MMTREEAILLSAYTGYLLVPDFAGVHKFCEETLGRPIWTHEFADRGVQEEIQEKLRPKIMEMIQNVSALRPVRREQVERIWFRKPYSRLETRYGDDGGIVYSAVNTCMACGHETPIGNFCHNCGVAQTSEAVEMVIERMEALHGIQELPTSTPPNNTPPCYQPDSDGCAYQCYDGDDEPIDKCKECPLCYSDKQRHHTPPNEPLTPYPDGDTSIIACPRCGSGEYLHNEDGNEQNYCGKCGQAIDWSRPPEGEA